MMDAATVGTLLSAAAELGLFSKPADAQQAKMRLAVWQTALADVEEHEALNALVELSREPGTRRAPLRPGELLELVNLARLAQPRPPRPVSPRTALPAGPSPEEQDPHFRRAVEHIHEQPKAPDEPVLAFLERTCEAAGWAVAAQPHAPRGRRAGWTAAAAGASR